MKEEEVKNIFRQIVQGVEYCHSRGVMHYDLKLENVLVNYDEKTIEINEIRVADFGFCSMRKELKNGKETRGTLPYMSPEMFYENGTFDKQSDSWALGVLLYALLTYTMPFKGATQDDVIDDITERELDFVENKVWEEVTIEASDLVENLLEKDPKQRYSVKEILKHSWLQSDTVETKINELN